MKKLIYKVCKNFTLSNDTQKKIDTSTNQEEVKGSHFLIGDAYVDYTVSETGEKVSEITETLLSNNFLLLESQINM
jgi:hypothetical protein